MHKLRFYFYSRLKYILNLSPDYINTTYIEENSERVRSEERRVVQVLDEILKDTPNHILVKMIVLSHNSRKILKDGDILILPVVLITPKALRPSV